MEKGSNNERKLVECYKRAGYAPYRPATVQFNENDMWGLFDVVALSPFDPCVHAVQSKTNGMGGITKWARHTALFRAHGFDTLYASRHDREGWVVDRVLTSSTGKIHRERLVDEREDERVTPHRGGELNLGDGLTAYLRGRNGLVDDT